MPLLIVGAMRTADPNGTDRAFGIAVSLTGSTPTHESLPQVA